MPVLRICRIAEVLRSAGFRKNQAKAAASLIRNSRGLDRSLVTGEAFEAALRNLEERVIARMTIRAGPMLFAAAGLALAAAKFLCAAPGRC